MRPNTAMDSDTVRSALRAPHGARHRERYTAQTAIDHATVDWQLTTVLHVVE